MLSHSFAQTSVISITSAVRSKSAIFLLEFIAGKSQLCFIQVLLVRLSHNADILSTLISVKVVYFMKHIGKKSF